MDELDKDVVLYASLGSYADLKLGEKLNEKYKLKDDYDFIESYGTFKSYLAQMVDKSEKQVKPYRDAAKWVSDNGLTPEDVKDISITKLNLMVKYQVPLTDDLLYDLRELAYSDLQIMYGGKAEYECDKEPN